METYVDALLKELQFVHEKMPLKQMFVGGGTPTTLPPHLLDKLLSGIFSYLSDSEKAIHCVESSPDSLTEDSLNILKKHNIKRISMGIQSLSDSQLKDINRKHSTAQTLNACKLAIEAGLLLNVDLIYGLPGQTQENFKADVEVLASLGVPSFTIYNLRLNDKTLISKNINDHERLEIEKLISWRQFVSKTMSELGYKQTRWHTFKRMDTLAASHKRLPHHTQSGQGYQLGIGLSARSHLGDVVYRNNSNLTEYVNRIKENKSPVEDYIHLKEADRKTQFVLSSLGDGKKLLLDAYESSFNSSFLAV